MTGDIELRKFRLIEYILRIAGEDMVTKLEKSIGAIEKEAFLDAVEPIQESVSLEELIKEQNYQPMTKAEFYNEISDLKIDEPLDELLTMLTP